MTSVCARSRARPPVDACGARLGTDCVQNPPDSGDRRDAISGHVCRPRLRAHMCVCRALLPPARLVLLLRDLLHGSVSRLCTRLHMRCIWGAVSEPRETAPRKRTVTLQWRNGRRQRQRAGRDSELGAASQDVPARPLHHCAHAPGAPSRTENKRCLPAMHVPGLRLWGGLTVEARAKQTRR